MVALVRRQVNTIEAVGEEEGQEGGERERRREGGRRGRGGGRGGREEGGGGGRGGEARRGALKDFNSPFSSAILHMTPLFVRYAYMSVPLALKGTNMPCT